MRPVVLAAALGAAALAPRVAAALPVTVTDGAELRAAVEGAAAGDVITLAPGTYDVTGNLSAAAVGTAAAPITVRAAALGEAFLRFDALEGFHVTAPYWVFENLDIQGVCALDDDCEHAFHVTGAADWTVIRGCRLHDFNAMIKGNGTPSGPGGAYVWPDDVRVEGNELFDAAPRDTANPVTPIDVVGGRRWILRANFIHDHAKALGDNISYAAFLKGNSRDGLIERNLVWCEMLHTGLVRLGLSFGGGGTSPDSICEDGTCTPEHQGGTMRNNIVVHCPADVGIYVNEGLNVGVYNNTLYDTTGLDVRFAATVADVRNNLLMGAVRLRDGATATLGSNLEGLTAADFAAWFAAPAAADFGLTDGTAFVDLGETLAAVPDDYCANLRDDGLNDVGAVEYDGDGPCDTTRPALGPGGGGGTDASASSADAGAGAGGDGGAPGADTGADDGVGGGNGGGGARGGCGCVAAGGGAAQSPAGVAAGALSLLGLVLSSVRRGARRAGARIRRRVR
jgi:hypothetical protein